VESILSETWHEERERLIRLLRAVESGEITHVDQNNQRQLQATSAKNIEELRKRLAELNARLG